VGAWTDGRLVGCTRQAVQIDVGPGLPPALCRSLQPWSKLWLGILQRLLAFRRLEGCELDETRGTGGRRGFSGG
jgi:hypothetical protein